MITIEWIEIKTSAKGSKYAKASVKDETGKTIDGVTIFGTFPKFDEIQPGSSVEGTIKTGEYMGKPQYTLEAKPAPRAGGAGFAGAAVRKEQSIAKAQDKKEEGIKIASTMNKAVDIAIAESTGKTGYSFEERITYWRQWLYTHWDDEMKPF